MQRITHHILQETKLPVHGYGICHKPCSGLLTHGDGIFAKTMHHIISAWLWHLRHKPCTQTQCLVVASPQQTMLVKTMAQSGYLHPLAMISSLGLMETTVHASSKTYGMLEVIES